MRNDDFDQSRQLDEMVVDPCLSRVDGISALVERGPDEVLMDREEAEAGGVQGRDEEDLWKVRSEAMNTLLRWIMEQGGDPLLVTRRVFELCKSYAPELLRVFGLESFEAQGKVLGVTRATLCASFKRNITGMVETSERRAGRSTPSFRAKFQKSATNVEKLSRSQKKSQAANGANRSKGLRKERGNTEVQPPCDREHS